MFISTRTSYAYPCLVIFKLALLCCCVDVYVALGSASDGAYNSDNENDEKSGEEDPRVLLNEAFFASPVPVAAEPSSLRKFAKNKLEKKAPSKLEKKTSSLRTTSNNSVDGESGSTGSDTGLYLPEPPNKAQNNKSGRFS